MNNMKDLLSKNKRLTVALFISLVYLFLYLFIINNLNSYALNHDNSTAAGRIPASSLLDEKATDDNSSMHTNTTKLNMKYADQPINLVSKLANQSTNKSQVNYHFVLKPSPNPVIQSFASKSSVYPGEELDFYVNSSCDYKVKIYRFGAYQNNSNVMLMYSDPNFHNYYIQPQPFYNISTNFVDPRWSKSFSFKIPSNWTTGVYFSEFSTEDNKDITYALFVVKNIKNKGDIVMKLPVNTYQAYNNWGGKSLYEYQSDNRTLLNPFTNITKRSLEITFDRPYAEDNGLGQFMKFDLPLLRFLEKNGYDVSYITDIDLHESIKSIDGYKAFISSGHDEYWSYQMRKNLEDSRDKGLNILFSGGNDIYWQIRFGDSFNGIKDRTIICYKAKEIDPLYGKNNSLVTVMWRDDPVKMPENSILGTITDEPWFTNGSFTITNSSNWVYKDTNFKDGDKVPGIIGYEVQHYIVNGFEPKNLTIIGHSFAKNGTNNSTYADTVIYSTPNKSLVFSAGSIIWNWGLDDQLYYFIKPTCDNPCYGLENWVSYSPKPKCNDVCNDLRIHILMKNILNKMIE